MPYKLSKQEFASLMQSMPGASPEEVIAKAKEIEASRDDRTFIGKTADTVVPTALRVLGAIGGGVAGTAVGGPIGTIAGGGAGAALGEELAQGYEQLRGTREPGFNWVQIATQGALGAVPFAGKATSIGRTAAMRGAQGAALGGAAAVATPLAEGESPTVSGTLIGAGLGAAMGGSAGVAEAKFLRKTNPFMNESSFINPEQTPLLNEDYGIVSWANPSGKVLTPEQNAIRQKLLRKALQDEGLEPLEQAGHFGGEPEPSFLVPRMTADQAKAFGRRGALPGESQASVMSKAGYHRLEDDATFPYQGVKFNQDMAENFSEIVLPGGRRVKYQLGVPDEAFGPVGQAAAEPLPSALPQTLADEASSIGQTTAASPSGQLTPSEEARQVAKITLEHRRFRPGLTRIEPKFYKPTRAEARRFSAADPNDVIQRNYYTRKGGFVEDRFKKGTTLYEADVDESKIYDFLDDPDGILAAARKDFPDSFDAAFTRAERVARDRGYIGYGMAKHENPMFRDTVALFEPMDVRQIDNLPLAKAAGEIGTAANPEVLPAQAEGLGTRVDPLKAVQVVKDEPKVAQTNPQDTDVDSLSESLKANLANIPQKTRYKVTDKFGDVTEFGEEEFAKLSPTLRKVVEEYNKNNLSLSATARVLGYSGQQLATSLDTVRALTSKSKLSNISKGGTKALAIAGPTTYVIPDDPDTEWDNYGKAALTLLSMGAAGAAIRGKHVKELSDLDQLVGHGAAALWAGGRKAFQEALGEKATPEILVRSQHQLNRFVKSAGGQLTNTNRLLKTAKQGWADLSWYDGVGNELKEMFGKDAEMVARFVALTSNNATVPSNATFALKAYTQWKNGEEFTGFMPAVIENLKRAKNGEWGGRKVDNFVKALMGDEDAVVVDRWVLRAFGFKSQTAPSDLQYDFMENTIRQMAKQQKVTPRQMQAAIWFAAKNAAEKGKNRAASPPMHIALRESVERTGRKAAKEQRRFDRLNDIVERSSGSLPFSGRRELPAIEPDELQRKLDEILSVTGVNDYFQRNPFKHPALFPKAGQAEIHSGVPRSDETDSLKSGKWYHGSTAEDIQAFSNDKIRGSDYDAPYTGVWVSSDEMTSPAMVNPKALYEVEPGKLDKVITRPEANKFARELFADPDFEAKFKASGAKGSGDYVRRELIKAGYDAVLHQDKPVINIEELERTGRTTFKLGWQKYEMLKEKGFGGLDSYDLYKDGDHITGFSHPQELIDQTERVLVILDADNARIKGRRPTPWQ